MQQPFFEQLVMKHPHDRPEAKERENLDKHSLFQLVPAKEQEQVCSENKTQINEEEMRMIEGRGVRSEGEGE